MATGKVFSMALITGLLILSFAVSHGSKENHPQAMQDVHDITLTEAKALIANFQRDLGENGIKGGVFQSEAIIRILAQDDCEGLRYYYARNDDGTPCLVLMGIDSNGDDMEYGQLAERSFLCPPFCKDTTKGEEDYAIR